jgi:hypothetical protein
MLAVLTQCQITRCRVTQWIHLEELHPYWEKKNLLLLLIKGLFYNLYKHYQIPWGTT